MEPFLTETKSKEAQKPEYKPMKHKLHKTIRKVGERLLKIGSGIFVIRMGLEESLGLLALREDQRIQVALFGYLAITTMAMGLIVMSASCFCL